MQGVRQHLLFEFLEKLFAALAIGTGSVLTPVALFPLVGRRVAWRKFTPHEEVSKTLAVREIALFLALALGALIRPALRFSPLDPLILAVFFLILSFGGILLAERSSAALAPKWSEVEWTGRGLRNLFGWLLLGLALTTFLRGMDSLTLMGVCVVAMVTGGVPLGMAYRRGEPGMLLLGALLLLVGIGFWNPWIAAAGMGWLAAGAVQVTVNLKASFALRSLACWVGAVAGLNAPSWVAVLAAAVLFVLTLEMWRFIVRLAIYWPLRTVHRFVVYGSENCSAEGAGIVVSNHVTLADGWLLGSMTQRMVRFLVFDAYYKNPASRFLLNLFRTIPISQGARREAVESLRQSRKVIEEGHFAGIFPEGGITRSGHLHPFQKGFTRIVAGTQIPVIPAYMNGLWTSLASFSEQKVYLRLGRFFRPFEIEFGTPLPPTVSANDLWRTVKGLEVNAAFRDAHHAEILPVAFLRAAGKNSSQLAVIDGNKKLTYGELASSALLFARHLNRRTNRKARIGIYLPDGIEKVIAHVAVLLAGHVAMEVPELSGKDVEDYVSQHGLGTVITSRAWIEAHGVPKGDHQLFIGRALEKVDSREQTQTWIYQKLSPKMAWKQVCAYSMRKDSAAAIVMSPRGPVVLSHRGIWSAAHGARRVLWWKPGVTVRNQMPLNRAVGLTLGLWMPLLHGAALVIGDRKADFELVDGPQWQQAHAESQHVMVVDSIEDLGERYLPIRELAEASGAVAISSPAVDFMGEVQSGAKAGTWGRLPFGLEIREAGDGFEVRGPARILRYLDAGETKTQARIDEWLAVDEPLELHELGFVITSERQTSSTPPPDQTPSNPQGE